MHRTERDTDPTLLQDVFDGHHYKGVCTRYVSWKGTIVRPPTLYFAQNTDVALAFGTDGIASLERVADDFWPLLVTILDLPPEIRTHREFQICCGLIPGELERETQYTAIT